MFSDEIWLICWCNALGSENAHTHHNCEHSPEFRFPAIKPPYLKRPLKQGEIGGEHLECGLKQDFTWFCRKHFPRRSRDQETLGYLSSRSYSLLRTRCAPLQSSKSDNTSAQ